MIGPADVLGPVVEVLDAHGAPAAARAVVIGAASAIVHGTAVRATWGRRAPGPGPITGLRYLRERCGPRGAALYAALLPALRQSVRRAAAAGRARVWRNV